MNRYSQAIDRLAHNLDNIVLPLAENIVLGLGAFFLLFFIIYLSSFYFRERDKGYVIKKRSEWNSLLRMLINGIVSVEDLKIPNRDIKFLRDLIVEEHIKEENSQRKNKLKEFYILLGMLEDDLKLLRSNVWWKRIQALERLTELEIKTAEKEVIKLLNDNKAEVRYSAIAMLVYIGSKELDEQFDHIFKQNSRWAYRYLVSKFYLLDIRADKLKIFAESQNRDLKKTATILLGKKGNLDALVILKKLSQDKIKDIRRETARAIGRIGSNQGLEILEVLMCDENKQVRLETARALGEIDDPKAIVFLEKIANDEEFDVRLQAFISLSNKGHEGLNVILSLKKIAPDLSVEFGELAKRHG